MRFGGAADLGFIILNKGRMTSPWRKEAEGSQAQSRAHIFNPTFRPESGAGGGRERERGRAADLVKERPNSCSCVGHTRLGHVTIATKNV